MLIGDPFNCKELTTRHLAISEYIFKAIVAMKAILLRNHISILSKTALSGDFGFKLRVCYELYYGDALKQFGQLY